MKPPELKSVEPPKAEYLKSIKNKKAGAFINALLLIFFFLILFYLTAYFLKFRITHLPGASISLLAVFSLLTSFTFGVFFISRKDISGIRGLLTNLVVFNLFLFLLTLIIAAGTLLFVILVVILLVPLSCNLFILGLLLRKSVEEEIIIPASADKNINQDKRRAQRIPDHIAVQHMSGPGSWQNVKVYDFSATGIRLIMDKPLEVNKTIDLKIIIPCDSRPVFAKARVVWSRAFSLEDNEFHTGAEFTDIDPNDVVRLTLDQAYSLFQERKL